jgi:hypothetical protein
MAVMPRQTWTDERLDDLSAHMDVGFREVREEIRALRSEMAAMQRSIHQLTFGLIGAVLTGFLATIAAILATSS